MNAFQKPSVAEQTVHESFSDIADHERMLQAFVRLLEIAVEHIAACLVALAIGGAEGHWLITLVLVVLATAAAALGALSDLAWRPGAAVLALAVACLALFG